MSVLIDVWNFKKLFRESQHQGEGKTGEAGFLNRN